jgi:hypothetical protein
MSEEGKKEEQQHSLNPQLEQEHVEALQNKARVKGWTTLEEWHGPLEDWVDAKEFLGREKLFNRIKELKDALHTNSQKHDREFQAMANHFSQMKDVEYKRALADLKGQLAFAKEERDVESVEKLTQQVAAVEQERVVATRVVAQTESQADPDKFRKFKQDNPWFDSDKELQDEAMSIGIGYSATHKEKSQDEVYDYVVKRIKKIYPEKFNMNENQNQEQNQEEETPRKVASVEGSTPTKKLGAKKSGKLSVSDLDEREKDVMKTFVKRGVLTQEAYLESLAKAKGLV